MTPIEEAVSAKLVALHQNEVLKEELSILQARAERAEAGLSSANIELIHAREWKAGLFRAQDEVKRLREALEPFAAIRDTVPLIVMPNLPDCYITATLKAELWQRAKDAMEARAALKGTP